MLSEVSELIDCEPLVFLLPDQSPEALQALALDDDQVRTVVPLWLTAAGDALSDTVGLGVGGAPTLTLMVDDAEPPAPEQLSENVTLLVRGPTDWLPLVALLPDHEPAAVQLVALVDDHVRVTLPS